MNRGVELESSLSPLLVRRAVEAALCEDLGDAGDITSNSIVPASARASAVIAAREAGTIAGLPLVEAAFRAVDEKIRLRRSCHDGDKVAAGAALVTIEGRARAILAGERVALNFLGHMSGIASQTAIFAEQVKGMGAVICCTRKTTPGLRAFEKYAVRAGGGVNHRYGLYDGVLIKDNHIAAAGSLKAAIMRARNGAGHVVKIEVEIDTMAQLKEAMALNVDAVLLDNMSAGELSRAVKLVAGRALCEASGGVNLKTVRAIAKSGVDLISVGALTHSAPSLDVGLDFL